MLLMCVELILAAVNTNFIAFSYYGGDLAGQIFVFFILTVAAAEVAIGLAILTLMFRSRGSIDIDATNTLKGIAMLNIYSDNCTSAPNWFNH